MLIAGLCLSLAARAAIDVRQFDNAAQERLYQEVTQQLRCPKCQNTSIADSDAIIAADMRAKVYQLMRQGDDQRQIIDFMVARYGNFVTYAPPVNPVTIILWLGPLLTVAFGAFAVARRTTRRDADRLTEPKQRRPADSSAETAAVTPPVGKWALIIGVAGLAAVTLTMYALSGGARQVWRWQQLVDNMPALRARIMDPAAPPLSARELAQFATGLRASLAKQPQNSRDWLILGRIGVLLNDAPMAAQAFERAYRLAPADDAILLDYARALTRSADAGDKQQAKNLLTSLVRRQPDNIQAINLLAIGYVERGDYEQAISLWRHVSTLLPPGDAHWGDIQRAINHARAQSGRETKKREAPGKLQP